MKLLKQVYQSVLHFNASSDKSRLTLLIESTFVWIVCRASLTKIKFYHQRKSTIQFSIHTLVSHMDIPFYIIGIYSLLRFLQKNPKLIIYDDGTLTADDYHTIARLPRASIIDCLQGNLVATKTFGIKSNLLSQRVRSPYNRKIIDLLLYKQANEKLLLLDSDVLFFRYPSDLVTFLTTDIQKVNMIYIQDIQNAYIAPMSKLNQVFQTDCTPRLNTGVLGFREDILTVSFVTDYYRALSTKFGQKPIFEPWIEQTGYAVLASTVKTKPLPHEYSIGKKYNRTTICKHYVHGERATYVKDLLMLILFTSYTK